MGEHLRWRSGLYSVSIALCLCGCADTEEDLRGYVHERMGPLLRQEAALIAEFNRRINEGAEDDPERAPRMAQFLADELVPRYVGVQQQMAVVDAESRRVRRLHSRYVVISAAQRKDFEELQMVAAAAARAMEAPESAEPVIRRGRTAAEPPESSPAEEPLPQSTRSLAEINASMAGLAAQRAAWEEELRSLCRKYDVGAAP